MNMILYGFRELNSVRVLVLKIQLKMQYQQDCPSPPSPVTEVLFSVNVRRPTNRTLVRTWYVLTDA